MSTVLIQKGRPTSPYVGNLLLEHQSDFITSVLAENAEQINNGDFVVHIIDPRVPGRSVEVHAYLADRESGTAVNSPGRLVLRDNQDAGLGYGAVENFGYVRAEAPAPAAPVELETFTVFGTNDDGEPFTAVITAAPDKVNIAARQAGASSPTYAYLVKITAILKGDQSDKVVVS